MTKIGTLRLYLAQINPTVGDLEGNFNIISFHIEEAKKNKVDIIVFPELSITGYPPEDLLLKPGFINKNLYYLDKIKDICTNIVAIVGFVGKDQEIYNSAAVIHNQKIKSIYHKQFLPNYSVFDEERYFQKGNQNYIYKVKGIPIGLNICEDIYYSGPTEIQSILGGAELVINISASPYYMGKVEEREKILFTRAIDSRVNIAYTNLVGGQDELVFDGNSLIINEKGKILARAKPFQEDKVIFDLNTQGISFTRLQDARFKNQRIKMRQIYSPLPIIELDSKADDTETDNINSKNSKNTPIPPDNINSSLDDEHTTKRYLQSHSDKPYPDPEHVAPEFLSDTTEKKQDIKEVCYHHLISCQEEEILKALVLGTRDYILKNGFKKVVIGLSGGVDSSLTAVIATLAIGKENVTGVIMPSIYSSEESQIDAKNLSSNLGINTIIIPITEIYNSYLENLKSIFSTDEVNITKENIQARIRGNILMALSNENSWLVLSTGNKSEISVGYCTLYGDMAGGFSPIKDVYKTIVYNICKFINHKYSNLIPQRILTKVPSAELKPDQKDQDKLPPYEILDSILKAYIEEEKDTDSIVDMGFDPQTIKEVINMVDSSEYKRRQGSPGIKITPRAFGRDRRYPITNKFKLF